jgi:hypothetical protein
MGRNQEEHGAKKAKEYPRRSLNGLVSQAGGKEEQSREMKTRNAVLNPETTRAVRGQKDLLPSKKITDPKAVSWCIVRILAQSEGE